jgi:hypothetical protein
MKNEFEVFCKDNWLDYYAQGNVPPWIPERPDVVYKEFWVSWSDWLGLSEEDFIDE